MTDYIIIFVLIVIAAGVWRGSWDTMQYNRGRRRLEKEIFQQIKDKHANDDL